jgi:hypothetical protein
LKLTFPLVPLVLGIDVVPPGLERPVTLSAVGVGVSQVLPVIVQCLVAGPGALVVLEQPELHLHPAAQQRLADFFLACTDWGQNLLVESHSEYLVLRLRRRVAEDRTDRLKDDLVLLFASRGHEGETVYEPIDSPTPARWSNGPTGSWTKGSTKLTSCSSLRLTSSAELEETAVSSDAAHPAPALCMRSLLTLSSRSEKVWVR